MKGTIEQCFRLYHNMFRSDLEHKGLIEKRHDSDHKKMACLTIEDFRKIVYMFIVYHNSQYSPSLYYCREMNEASIPKIPIEYWKFGIQRNGSPRMVNEAQLPEVLFNLMPSDTATITHGTIKYKNLHYREVGDDELAVRLTQSRANANRRDSDGNRLNEIEIRFDPRCVNHLYYTNSEGKILKLFMNTAKSGSYADLTWNEYLELYRNEKAMDKKYERYQLEMKLEKNRLVKTIADSVVPGTVKATGVRKARKTENAKLNKENAISNRLVTESDEKLALQEKTDADVPGIETAVPAPDKDNYVPELLSETVPEIFKELIK